MNLKLILLPLIRRLDSLVVVVIGDWLEMTRRSRGDRVLEFASRELAPRARGAISLGRRVYEKDALNDCPLVVHAGNVLSGIDATLRDARRDKRDLYADAPEER